MSKTLRVLVVEDSESDAALVVRLLRSADYDVINERVETAEQMRTALGRHDWDVIICDIRLPRFDAPAALALLRETGKDVPFLVVSGKIGEDAAVAMMRAGAHDYLVKENLKRLVPAVEREVREASARKERRRAEETLRWLSIRHEAILNEIPDIVMEVDNRKVYTWANQAGIEFFGDDVCGKEAAHFFVDEQETYEKVRSLFKGEGGTFYIESWQRRKDGEERLLAWWCRALKDHDGRVTGALSTARAADGQRKNFRGWRRNGRPRSTRPTAQSGFSTWTIACCARTRRRSESSGASASR
jgi:PAS domain S-box-containing protein